MTNIDCAITVAYLTPAGTNVSVDIMPNQEALYAYTAHKETYRNKLELINRNHHPTMQPSLRSHWSTNIIKLREAGSHSPQKAIPYAVTAAYPNTHEVNVDAEQWTDLGGYKDQNIITKETCSQST